MCLWFACFGLHKHDDDCYAPPSTGGPTKPPHDRPPQAPHSNGYNHGHQGAHYGNGVYRASPNQTTAAAAAAAEAGHKASNDARRGPTAAGAMKQQPAWNGKADHYYYYEREPVHREAAAMDHRYSTATATADHERY